DGRVLAEFAAERRVFVPIEAIPKRVIDAFLSAEDKNFYGHHGIDPLSIIRAGLTNVGRLSENRRPVGASTITQQVAKNMLLSNEISIERKIKEILLASRIEAALPKDRILELYLNQIYLGAGAYGVVAAALTYFNKSLDELTLGEAAVLAGLPKAPNRYSPIRHPEMATARREWVLDRMVEAGATTRDEIAQAKTEPIQLRRRQDTEEVRAPYFAEEVRRELLARYGEKVLYGAGFSVRTSLDGRLQAAADKALRSGLIAYEHSHGGWRGAIARIDPKGDWTRHLARLPVPAVAADVGWRLAMVVRSDPDGALIGFGNGATGRIPFSAMRWARPRHADGNFGPYPRAAADVVKPGDVVMVEPLGASSHNAEAAAGNASTATFTLCQVPEISGALVVMDPHTGRVLALSGGFSFEISQFDRATQAKRQPGSSIKPFVYLTALDHGFTPSTLVVDGPISLPQGPGLPMWSPTNYTRRGQEVRYRGPTPLRVGLELSLNAMTARVASIVGMEPIAQTIERFGIMDHTPREYSMALGTGETTPLRLTTAYAMLANGGKRVTATLIERVQDRNGATIFRADQRPCAACTDFFWDAKPVPALPDTREPVADPASAFQIVTMMQGVVQRGTGVAVKAVGKPVAGKTGTSNDFRDAWFIGFTPDLVAGVYIGFDDPDSLGEDETGGHIAAPVFRDFMMAALKDAPATAFHTPPGMRLYRVNPATGLAASGGQAIYEGYKPGTEPGTNRHLGLQGPPDETPIRSSAVERPLTRERTGAGVAPASGTGGLY
ncbi:MAG: penicillin-binding protein 1A, partial [Alphaproteobacteria bacterium]|nr:penicillin-binding protein 1A [Alphaproteobacteria bacterium]